eukprot:3113843-Prymnesium_polylepis.1
MKRAPPTWPSVRPRRGATSSTSAASGGDGSVRSASHSGAVPASWRIGVRGSFGRRYKLAPPASRPPTSASSGASRCAAKARVCRAPSLPSQSSASRGQQQGARRPHFVGAPRPLPLCTRHVESLTCRGRA